jgi:hypothetical protein
LEGAFKSQMRQLNQPYLEAFTTCRARINRDFSRRMRSETPNSSGKAAQKVSRLRLETTELKIESAAGVRIQTVRESEASTEPLHRYRK